MDACFCELHQFRAPHHCEIMITFWTYTALLLWLTIVTCSLDCAIFYSGQLEVFELSRNPGG